MSSARENVSDHLEVVAVLTRYATALDSRQFGLLDDVFTDDLSFTRTRMSESVAQFRGYPGGDDTTHQESGRGTRVASIKHNLGGCSFTQHLLGNFRISIRGDSADSICAVRAFHVGAGSTSSQTYEVFGEYHDALVRTDRGWRIARRRSVYYYEQGDATVLGTKTDS